MIVGYGWCTFGSCFTDGEEWSSHVKSYLITNGTRTGPSCKLLNKQFNYRYIYQNWDELGSYASYVH